MKKFTIVFPSRERINLLNRMITSIESTTANKNDIEVFVAVDQDDVETIQYAKRNQRDFLRFFFVKRSLNFSRDYYNFLAKQGSGRYIIAVNDDGVFETPNWDISSWAILEDYVGDGPCVVHGWIEDGIDGFRAVGHGEYCCFPLIGREGFNALGQQFFPDRIPTWGADIWMRKLYDTVDRVVRLPMMIRHYCHHNKTRDQDQISKRIANNQVPFDVNPQYAEINNLLGVLRQKRTKV